MNRFFSRSLTFAAILAMGFVPALAAAQEPAPEKDAAAPVADQKADQPAPEAAPAPAQPAAEQAAADANAPEQLAPADEAPAPSNDPGDLIAAYFNEMSDIVSKNMDSPDKLVDEFASFIKNNEKSMRTSSKNFEAKMASLKSDEAEVYRDSVQRKITPALHKLISQLIDFQNRYPEQAAKLDSLLKVDAKYTYQQ